MKSLYEFIVTPVGGNRYNNMKEVEGIDLIVSTSEEDSRFANREATVLETPINYDGPIEPGDIMIVHHNVFKFYNDMKGNRKSGKSFFRDDIFFVDDEQYFAFKKGGKWYAHDKYCFIKPVPIEQSEIYNPSKYEPLVGEMVIPNNYLLNQGVKAGDKVGFKPTSEYEFLIDGEILYRTFDHMITLVL